MTRLYVAAGGGGDALAAAIVHRARGSDEPAVIASYAWDRLSVDPLPGPRSAVDFLDLRPIGSRNYALTPTTKPRPPSGSTLPRLAHDLADTLVLLDPAHGAAGMRAQLDELGAIYATSTVTIIDVGGDVLARGDEAGLRSPLADALTLAAGTGLDVPVAVMVAGPGLDGELTEGQVLDVTGTVPWLRLTAEDVEPFRPTFDWHPSEATALLAAAARGIRGQVEIRDGGLPVELKDNSPALYRLPIADVTAVNPLAKALVNAATLSEAEDITHGLGITSEIDYERAKARRHAGTTPKVERDLDAAVRAFEHDAASRGVEYVTFRRIAEAVGPFSIDVSDLRDHLIETRPEHYNWPLWSVTAKTDNLAH